MKWLLDTNVCIYLIRKSPVAVIDRIISLPLEQIAVSTITIAELEYRITKSAQPVRNRLALVGFLTPFRVVDFDGSAAFAYGRIRTDLERAGRIIGSMDLLIAAHAISLGLTLVTNNEREFGRVAGLRVENWV